MSQRLMFQELSLQEKIIIDYQSGKSLRQVAKEFKINRSALRNILLKKGFMIRQRPISFHIPQIRINAKLSDKNKEIIQGYQSGKSTGVLAKEYHCSNAGILRVLKKNNIFRRQNPLKKIFSKDLLIDLYIDKKKSIREIVKETKSHEATIRKNLKKIGIIPRRFNEQQLIDNDNGKKINLNKIKENIEKDPRFFYVLGAIKGDGWYDIKNKKIPFSVTDFDFIEEVKKIFIMLSPETKINIRISKKETERTKRQYGFTITSRDFFKKELYKLLPHTLQEKRFYLKGLFDAEGSVSQNGLGITICQKNINDLKLWKEWLEELGIITTMHIGNGKISKRIWHDTKALEYFRHGKIIKRKWIDGRIYYTKSDAGHLRILGNDSKINFYDIIGFKIKRKHERLEKGIKKIKQLPVYDISNELIMQDLNKIKGIKVKSIKFSHREQGVDLSILNSEHHNFILSNGITSSNSTMAQQIAYFIAWLIAGGKMKRDLSTRKWYVSKNPDKEVHFILEENIVFSPEQLMKKAADLYNKYGKNQVIVYDEGRAGLDSASAMQAINRVMQDFFQECGMYGHVIIVVLPNFFKLHEDYAVNRSLFLIDTYADKNLRRGYFNFYNEIQKEWLFYMGKKKIGSTLKYSDSRPSFSGRFTQFLPLNKDAYETAKREALKTKGLGLTERKWKKQRDAALYIIRKSTTKTLKEMSEDMTAVCGFPVGEDAIEHGIESITHAGEPPRHGHR